MSGDYREASAKVRRDIRDHRGHELVDCERIREHAVGMVDDRPAPASRGAAERRLPELLA